MKSRHRGPGIDSMQRFKPYPEYRDSGVAQLGNIPAHWDNGTLRRFWSVVDCKHRSLRERGRS